MASTSLSNTIEKSCVTCPKCQHHFGELTDVDISRFLETEKELRDQINILRAALIEKDKKLVELLENLVAQTIKGKRCAKCQKCGDCEAAQKSITAQLAKDAEDAKGLQGIFFIRNVNSGLYLDAEAFKFVPGTYVCQYPMHCGVNQRWELNKDGTISPAGHPEVALEISGGAKPENNLWLQKRTGDAAQKFTVQDGKFIKHSSGLVVDIPASSKTAGRVIVFGLHGGANQQFVFEPCPAIIEGKFMAKNVNSELYLDMEGGESCTFAVGVYMCQFQKHGLPNQWFQQNEDYTISPAGKPNVVLDIAGGAASGNQLVLQAHAPEKLSQRFYVDGQFIKNFTGFVIDIPEASKKPTRPIVSVSNSDSPSQKFEIERS